jgi:multiple sugar transport system substrate-binding protein
VNRTVTALACTGLLSTVTACSGFSSGSGSSTEESTGPVTVTVMTWESKETNAAIDAALKGFQDPNIKVQRIDTPSGAYGDKLASLTQAKKLPDLFWCGNDTEQQYTGQGLLVDWAPRLNEGELAADKFVPSSIENWKTADGKMGGLPSLMNTYGVWYNADAFAAAGLAVPTAGWTFDQLYDAAGKLSKTNGATFGLVADMFTSPDGPFTMSTYSLSAGGKPFTDSVNHPTAVEADEKLVEGTRKLAEAVKAGHVAPPGYDASNIQSLFAAGKVPMVVGGQWLAAGFLTDKPKVTYGFAPLPQVDKPVTLYDAVGICTPSYTKNADATYKVLEFINTTVWSKVLPSAPVAPPAYLPAQQAYFDALTKAGQTSVVDTVKTDLAMTDTTGVRFTTPWASQSTPLLTAHWQPVVSGKKPVEELQTLTKKLNDLIKTNS